MAQTRTNDAWRSLGVVLWTVQLLVVSVLLQRRLAGEFAGPVPGGIAMLWAMLMLAWGGAALVVYRTACPRATPPSSGVEADPFHLSAWLPECLATAVTATAVFAGLPGMEPFVFGALIGLILIGVGTWHGMAIVAQVDIAGLRNREGEAPGSPSASPQAPAPDGATTLENLPPVQLMQAAGDESDFDADACQTMTRRREADVEIVEGQVRVVFDANQREQTVHLAFCPPLTSRPDVELEDLDGNGWELKVAAAYPFGVRIAVRRRPDASPTGHIAYFASAMLRQVA